MYCKNCGKEIDYEADLCKECESKLSSEVKVDEKPVDNGSQKTGFKIALIGAILCAVAYFLSIFATTYITTLIEELKALGITHISGTDDAGLIFIGLIPAIISIPLSIVSIVFGAKSIGVFKAEKNAGRVKPIPALVMGIVSVVLSSICLFLSSLAILLCLLI